MFQYSFDPLWEKSDNYLLNWLKLYKSVILQAASEPLPSCVCWTTSFLELDLLIHDHMTKHFTDKSFLLLFLYFQGFSSKSMVALHTSKLTNHSMVRVASTEVLFFPDFQSLKVSKYLELSSEYHCLYWTCWHTSMIHMKWNNYRNKCCCWMESHKCVPTRLAQLPNWQNFEILWCQTAQNMRTTPSQTTRGAPCLSQHLVWVNLPTEIPTLP